jgi:exonuclease SbcD
MSFTFLHAADIHLDSPLLGLQKYEGAPVDALRLAPRAALQRLVQLAIDRRVAFVVISGDLYDGVWPDYNTGLFFVNQARRLHEAGIPLYLIAGNHDAQNKMTRSLPLPPSATLFSADAPQTVTLDDLGVALHGQSFATQSVKEDLSLRYPAGWKGYFNVGLLHTSATGREGHDDYAPCTLAGLEARQYQYWALGHVHQRETLCEEPWITFSGNVQGRHIRETGPKGCWLVSVDDKLQARPQFEPLDVLRWEVATVDVAPLLTEDDLWEAIGRQLRTLDVDAGGLPSAVRVRLTGATRLHERLAARREHVTAHIRSLGIQHGQGRIWIEKVALDTRPQRRAAPVGSAADNPREELAGYVSELRTKPEELAALGTDIVELCQKLPADLDLAAAGLAFTDDTALLTLLEEAEAILLDRLADPEADA